MRRALIPILWCGLLVIGLSGCQKATEPEPGPLRAGPYPECRSIVSWLRIKHHDSEATVTRWGPRTQEDKGSPVLVEVHYNATIGAIPHGRWTQTLRVIGSFITEETEPVAEE